MPKYKLIFTGPQSNAQIMNWSQYETFLRSCSSIDFDTHIAIDLHLDQTSLNTLRVLVAVENRAVQLKLVK